MENTAKSSTCKAEVVALFFHWQLRLVALERPVAPATDASHKTFRRRLLANGPIIFLVESIAGASDLDFERIALLIGHLIAATM